MPHDRRRIRLLLLALVKAADADKISKLIAAAYKAKTGIEASIFSSRPAAGAIIIKQ